MTELEPLGAPGLAAAVERRRLRSADEAAGLESLVVGKCFGAAAALSLGVARFAEWAAIVLFVESVLWVFVVVDVAAAAQSTEASSAGGWLH